MDDYTHLYEEMGRDGGGEAIRRWVVESVNGVVSGARSDLTAMHHPLGFVCLPLERVGEHGVCVHVWTPGAPATPPTTSPIHSHSWDLVSFVLFGVIRNEILPVSDAPADPTHRVFEVRSRGDVDEIRATPRLVRCGEPVADDNDAGQVYTLPAGSFHMTVVDEAEEAATVVLGRTRAGSVDLSLGDLDTASHEVRRARCDPASTLRAARIVADRLASAGAQ